MTSGSDAEQRTDAEFLDWLGTGHAGHDILICSPGNHGGDIGNWLLAIDTWGRDCGNKEYEAPTLRQAIEAAIKDGIK